MRRFSGISRKSANIVQNYEGSQSSSRRQKRLVNIKSLINQRSNTQTIQRIYGGKSLSNSKTPLNRHLKKFSTPTTPCSVHEISTPKHGNFFANNILNLKRKFGIGGLSNYKIRREPFQVADTTLINIKPGKHQLKNIAIVQIPSTIKRYYVSDKDNNIGISVKKKETSKRTSRDTISINKKSISPSMNGYKNKYREIKKFKGRSSSIHKTNCYFDHRKLNDNQFNINGEEIFNIYENIRNRKFINETDIKNGFKTSSLCMGRRKPKIVMNPKSSLLNDGASPHIPLKENPKKIKKKSSKTSSLYKKLETSLTFTKNPIMIAESIDKLENKEVIENDTQLNPLKVLGNDGLEALNSSESIADEQEKPMIYTFSNNEEIGRAHV